MSSRRGPGQRSPAQEALFSLTEIPQPPPYPAMVPGWAGRPDLASYDILLANVSGGKESQAMLRKLVGDAERAGVRDRIVVVFSDLGEETSGPAPRSLPPSTPATTGCGSSSSAGWSPTQQRVRSGSRGCWSTSSTAAPGRTSRTVLHLGLETRADPHRHHHAVPRVAGCLA
jgi:hypothetical protein